MKSKALVLFIGIFLISACQRTSDKALQYSNVINQEMKHLADMEKEMSLKDGPELIDLIEKFKLAVPVSKLKIEKLGTFSNDDSLQLVALTLCNFYMEVIDGKWANKGQVAIESKNIELDNQFKKVYSEFAVKYKFSIPLHHPQTNQ